jgi:hypothetical protein
MEKKPFEAIRKKSPHFFARSILSRRWEKKARKKIRMVVGRERGVKNKKNGDMFFSFFQSFTSFSCECVSRVCVCVEKMSWDYECLFFTDDPTNRSQPPPQPPPPLPSSSSHPQMGNDDNQQQHQQTQFGRRGGGSHHDRGQSQQQQQQHQQQQVADDPKFKQAMSRMFPLGVKASHLTVHPEKTHLLPNAVYGLDQISSLLWDVLVMPQVGYRIFAHAMGSQTALHFCLAGPEGSGKRMALTNVCTTCGIDMLTITPYWYAVGDIECAINYARMYGSCVIYFDDFEFLSKNDLFRSEFSTHVLGLPQRSSMWNGLWFAFSVPSKRRFASIPVLRDLCADRMAEVECLTEDELFDLFLKIFLPSSEMRIKQPTPEQEDAFKIAARDRTPKELQTFAGRVKWHALCRCKLDTVKALSLGVAGRHEDLNSRGPPIDEWRVPEIPSVDWDLDVESLYEKDERLDIPVNRIPTMNPRFGAINFE